MQRGDLVTVSLQGDYGKPRPALIVQSDLLTDLESVVLCPVTSDQARAREIAERFKEKAARDREQSRSFSR